MSTWGSRGPWLHPQGGAGGLRHALPGRLDRGLPGRVPRQIGTLPRLQPRCFYDLAIEIALIRPGPIQGGAVHPYVRRATGKEEVTYAHPVLIPVLERTRGVPLFQEQLMEMGRVLGDFDADDADLLRRAMGSKRGVERIESLKEQLLAGMLDKG